MSVRVGGADDLPGSRATFCGGWEGEEEGVEIITAITHNTSSINIGFPRGDQRVNMGENSFQLKQKIIFSDMNFFFFGGGGS